MSSTKILYLLPGKDRETRTHGFYIRANVVSVHHFFIFFVRGVKEQNHQRKLSKKRYCLKENEVEDTIINFNILSKHSGAVPDVSDPKLREIG